MQPIWYGSVYVPLYYLFNFYLSILTRKKIDFKLGKIDFKLGKIDFKLGKSTLVLLLAVDKFII